MKDNISIIFAAIIGTFLIVLLPLYSILDRQDSMSYNVVLTSTTNFVDSIRNNGFIDKESYYNYISALASTSNTYKVTLEAYKKTLIRETDEAGNIIPDSFVEEIELYNTQDILEVIEGEKAVNTTGSNKKNNVYLFDENDEIYIKVYNTNITSGSVIYNLIAGVSNNQVINISYGGVINKINWELYDKIQTQTEEVPEVIMSVPVNSQNSTNVKRITKNGEILDIDCTLENLEDYIGVTDIEELCGDTVNGEYTYTYLYDLKEPENKTIRVAVELDKFYSINTGTDDNNNEIYTPLAALSTETFAQKGSVASEVEKYIISNYIQLNGFFADVDLTLRADTRYYVFDIILTKVRMSLLDYISSKASITIMPGLGQDNNGTLSLGADSVEIELMDESAVNTVVISSPYNWKKLLKTKDPSESVILNSTVYKNQEIAFVISYTGINNQTDEDIVSAIRQNLRIHETGIEYSDIDIYTANQFKEMYGIDMTTETTGRVIVKFKYAGINRPQSNYVELLDGWIETNVEDILEEQEGEELVTFAIGAESTKYSVQLDEVGPIAPTILLDGTLGEDGWYTSDVTLRVEPSTDLINQNGLVETENGLVSKDEPVVGGSGIYRTTLSLSGAQTNSEQEMAEIILNKNGVTSAIAKSYDYIDNASKETVQEIKIDKESPTAPKVVLSGTKGKNGWYTSDVRVSITPGRDTISGVDRTTYKIEGSNAIKETEGTSYILTENGKSTVIVTTYDKAGNKTETTVNVYMDESVPADATISVVGGDKHSPDVDWYYTDVTVRIQLDASDSASGLGTSSYRITGYGTEIEVPITQFEGATKEITLTKNGTHNITVYTYTKAGNFKETRYTVKIDKDAPNQPSVEIVNGTIGEGGWYTTNVAVAVASNGDVGSSSVYMMTYTITKDGKAITDTEQEIMNNGMIFLNEDGEYVLTVYSRDMALNKVQIQQTIKIDKTKPTSADFVIEGTKGKDDWYTSEISISHTGAADSTSGIKSVQLSLHKITSDTQGKTVTLVTKDNAGNVATNSIFLKVDITPPTDPIINIAEEATGTGVFGVLLYNKNINVSITPGNDTMIDKTTYEVTTNDGATTLVSETEGTSYKITQEGTFTITARTYDKAGNVSEVSKTVWINKEQPSTPKIMSINGVDVSNINSKTVTSTENTITLQIDNLTQGNEVRVVLINQETYATQRQVVIATQNTPIEITLSNKGTYSISVTQSNMFGTTSESNTGLYYYKYK